MRTNTLRGICGLALLPLLLCFASCSTVTESAKSGYYTVKYGLKGPYYLDNHKYKEGIEAFQEELKSNPDNPEANYYMGRLQLSSDHPKEAQPYLEKAARLSPKNADYQFWAGVAYGQNGKKDLEFKCYQRAIELEPSHVEALTYQGHVYLERSEHQQALANYRKVLELDPDNPSALYNRALALNRLKRSAEERQAWLDYLSMYSGGAMARQAATHLNEMGDFQYRNYLIGIRTITLESIKFQPASAEIEKSSYESLDTLGDIMKNNQKVSIHVVTYQKNNAKLAEARARSVKSYLLKNFPEIDSSRLILSWFGLSEQIKTEKKTFKADESVNFITAVQEKEKRSASNR
jgi:tetratricopeptide (TPR) repeat protein